MTWFFVSDLHGRIDRYRALLEAAARERPEAILLGGDLLPSQLALSSGPARLQTDFSPVAFEGDDFVRDVMACGFRALRERLGSAYPKVLLILGNDDPRSDEPAVVQAEADGVWSYAHNRAIACCGVRVFGYACVPPTPFLLKDWERYDVSRYVDPGCCSPEDGWRSVPAEVHEVRNWTIQDDLAALAGDSPLGDSVWLFHAPPHETALDRAALDNVVVDHVPLDVHIGSIAIRRFIEARQPLVTLHGHIHESARLTGCWQQQIGRTFAFSAAHDGKELALVRFDPRNPAAATRTLL